MLKTISVLFGYVLNFIYGIVGNYGIAIILFSLVFKILLLPITIKQQKTMKKTQKIQEEMKVLQEKYKNDQVKMNQEMMELYKKENMSPFSGCLSSILQIFLLIAVFGLVRNPLTYMKRIDTNIVNSVIEYISEEEEVAISKNYPEIGLLKYVINNKDNKSKINIGTEEEVKEVNLDDLYINMDFLGLDLSDVPQENLKDIKVLVIPVLYVVTSLISMLLTTKTGQKKKNENAETSETENMTNQMSKGMTLFMPIMAVSISLVAPLGLALYWLMNNILMIIERIVFINILGSKEESENE